MAVTRDIATNREALLRAIDHASRDKAAILITPEGSLSGYTAKFDAEATDRAIQVVVRRAKDLGVALVLGTCFMSPEGHRYDAQQFYDPTGRYLGFHAKTLLCQHVSEPGRRGEVDDFQTAPLRTFELCGTRVGGLVCNDLWANPEWTPMPDPFLVRQLARLGARVILHSVNSGFAEGEDPSLNRAFHESNLKLRARSAGVWIVVANAADPTGRLEVSCPSGVVSPQGRWTAQVNVRGEQLLVHEFIP
ncbi:MAG: carbon-nitrogen hydrolase family protein [Verrucomicrobiales bacterium]|nr:carbon-nitrogen hydrolase family protein [Verrucomicrobiales bacterium]